MKNLSETEFQTMIMLLQRHASAGMDQFEHWKFDSEKGKVFLELSLKPRGPEEAYEEVGNMP